MKKYEVNLYLNSNDEQPFKTILIEAINDVEATKRASSLASQFDAYFSFDEV